MQLTNYLNLFLRHLLDDKMAIFIFSVNAINRLLLSFLV